jgi:hypothetical protein
MSLCMKFNSVFNSLNTLHVSDPGLLPCVAHDPFEGVVCYDLPLFLCSLIDVVKRSGQTALMSVH